MVVSETEAWPPPHRRLEIDPDDDGVDDVGDHEAEVPGVITSFKITPAQPRTIHQIAYKFNMKRVGMELQGDY